MARPSVPSPRSHHRFEYVGLTMGSAAMLVTAVVAAGLLRGAFIDAHRTLGWVIACSVVALLLDPLVSVANRVLPRSLAVVTVLIVVLGVVALVGVGVAREIDESLEELVVVIPDAAADVEAENSWAVDVRLSERAQDFADDLDEAIRGDALARAADTAPTYVVTGILMLFLLAGGRRYVDGFADQFAEPRRTRLKRVVRIAAVRGRVWLLMSVVVGIVVGIAVGALSWLLDLPAAVSLGVLAGVAAVIPFVGTIIGGLVAVLLAFAVEGRWAGIAMLALVLALQVADAVIARHWIESRSVRVGATIPILCALVGYELYRGGGAVYGVAVGVLGISLLAAVGGDERRAATGDP